MVLHVKNSTLSGHSIKWNFLTVYYMSLLNDIVGLFTNNAVSQCVHTDRPASEELNIVGIFPKNALSLKHTLYTKYHLSLQLECVQ